MRPLRIEYPVAFYHIIARGNTLQKIFLSDKEFPLDAQQLLEYIPDVVVEANSYTSYFPWLCIEHSVLY